MARTQTFSDGSFQYADSGPEALLCPVELDSGEIVDTVAWFSERSADWWMERRIATHLGDRALRYAAFLQKPIRLLASPAAWLDSPHEAICILDWSYDLRALFREVPEVRCATPALKTHLSHRLAEQVAPRFKITAAP
jgi:hypothetical protein